MERVYGCFSMDPQLFINQIKRNKITDLTAKKIVYKGKKEIDY